MATSQLPFDDQKAPLYTVGQVADMLRVQPAFLRRLDTEEVVQPARSAGGQRRYTREEIRTVEKAVGLAGEGLTLAGIRRLLVLEDQVRDLERRLADREEEESSPE
ncbi:MAG TPA: helix-turn-helix domain-containing protein [Acidimicrobiales bacterium]|nr:helix-turn-helix domain-containing protein [Acidimicrobiales bacterium]